MLVRSFEDRVKSGKKLKELHGKCAFVHVSPMPNRQLPEVSRHIFVVDHSAAASCLMQAVRARIPTLKSQQALFFMVDNNKNNWNSLQKNQQLIMLDAVSLMSTVEQQNAKLDGYVYVYYDIENAFG